VSEYLIEGNGLVYTGEPKERNVLPNRPIDREDQSKGAKIMLAIDISQSTGESGSVKNLNRLLIAL